MKLWTEMKRDTDGEWFANDPDPNQCKGAIARDAVVAHALMIALERWAARRADHASYADHLLGHADEIMAGWGFDSGEVE